MKAVITDHADIYYKCDLYSCQDGLFKRKIEMMLLFVYSGQKNHTFNVKNVSQIDIYI